MKALILVNGELYRPEVLKNRIQAEAFDLVLGTDGGARYADMLNVRLDTVIGDMDSLPVSEQQRLADVEFIPYPVRKNETDLELSLLYAVDKGARHVVMVGVMGGRMDMTIANVLLMAHQHLNSCRVEVWHGAQTGWLVKPPGEYIPGNIGDVVSFIPLGGDADGVTTRHFKYPLKDERLILGSSRGTSNVISSSAAKVELSAGLMLAVHTPAGK